jgi:hypothetical protein
VVDGSGLKNTLEYQAARALEANLKGELDRLGRRTLFTAGADRWGMSMGFVEGGYEFVFGDLMFGLGLPIPIRNVRTVKLFVALFMPVIGRLPFEWLYPTGEKQEARIPMWEKYYQWASVVAGDRHYIVRHMPQNLKDKIIVTNTTTADDVELFRAAGVRYLMTTTPVLGGRSFGTNMMEAALVAVAGWNRKLTRQELAEMLGCLEIEPTVQELNQDG